MASEIHLDVYREILDACRPFYAFEDQRQDCCGTSMEQNIPPRLEDGLPKLQPTDNSETCKVRSCRECSTFHLSR
ncbi:hypothetical protein FisN_10Lu288 [Fistulifera solaris]|uniref:Uncharacterized protein n=1 Tax=Fistulifera solaris TaxID=1519565 RepID=A0A1Z5KGJ3_FISSO|nr:hypothetical protein FisN_10Lu288 [Fistulifera solaris]|eukprot:GAX25088.1 hypothetical protein FisN_10Lu288 [Fistulifera solaris]